MKIQMLIFLSALSFFALGSGIAFGAQQQDSGSPARRVIVFVWDGLRADDVTSGNMPNYFALARSDDRVFGSELDALHDAAAAHLEYLDRHAGRPQLQPEHVAVPELRRGHLLLTIVQRLHGPQRVATSSVNASISKSSARLRPNRFSHLSCAA